MTWGEVHTKSFILAAGGGKPVDLKGSVQGQAGRDLEQLGIVEGHGKGVGLPMGRGWDWMVFKVPSKPNHSGIP